MSAFIIVEENGVFTDMVTFDATLSETHTNVSSVTRFPVEDGASVTDHVREEPKRLSLEVLMTNHPTRARVDFKTFQVQGFIDTKRLNLPKPFDIQQRFSGVQLATPGAGTRIAMAALEGRLVPPTRFATVLTFDPHDAPGETYDKLLTLKASAVTLRVVTALVEYKNMVLSAIRVPRTQDNGESVTFLLEFEEIRKVTAATVAAPKVPAEPRGAGAKKGGGKGTKDATKDAGKNINRSFLAKLVDGAF